MAAKAPKIAVAVKAPVFKIDNIPCKFVALDNAAVEKNTKTIRRNGTKQKVLMHETAVGILMYMQSSGRYDRLVSFIDAVNDAQGAHPAKALKEWMLAYTWLAWNDETKAFFKDKSKKIDLDEAMQTPFWTFIKPPVETPFDFQKMITAFLDKAEKAIEKGTFKGDPRMIDAIKELKLPAPSPELVKTKASIREAVAAE